MLGWLIEIRNFFLAISLGWLGVTFAAPDQNAAESDEQATVSTEDTANPVEISP